MYEKRIRLGILQDALNFITEEDSTGEFVLIESPLLKIKDGMIRTINDKFFIENAEVITGGITTKLSVDQAVEVFTEQISENNKLLLKGKYGPFVEIKVIDKKFALIRF